MSKGKRSKSVPTRPKGFFQFYRQIYDSEAFRSLSCIERVALLHLMYHYIPDRSEVIVMSNRRLARDICINKDTAGKALKRLEQVGLIRMVDESDWYRGAARSYRLTFMNYQGRQPTDEWAAFQNQGQGYSDNVTPITRQLGSIHTVKGVK